MLARRTLALWVAVAAIATPLVIAGPEETISAKSEAEPEAAATVLKGTVRGPDDAPLPGATVRILAKPDSKQPTGSKKQRAPAKMIVVETGEGGRFEATGLSGEEFTVRVEAEGHAPFQQAKIPAGASLTLQLEPPQTVSGRVVGIENGKPLPGITVQICKTTALRFGPEACPTHTTDDDGRFTVTDLPEGRLRLTAVSPRHALASRDLVTPTGDLRLEVALTPGGRLAGVVVGPDGEPVEGVWVYAIRIDDRKLQLDARKAGRQHAETDDTGWFEIEGLPAPGSYRFDVRKDGYATTREGPLSLEPGDDRSDLVFRLTRGAAFRVRLVDADERPVAGLEVQLEPSEESESPDPLQPRRQGVTREQIRSEDGGRFVVENLAPGTVTVYLWPADGEEVVRESVRLRDGGSVDLGVIVVRPGRGIAGVVTDVDGGPIEGATINAVWRQEERRYRHARATADADGRFRLSGLGDASVGLQVAAEGFVPIEERDVDPGVEGLEFILERPGKVFGRVVFEDGTGAMAQVRGIPGARASPFALGRGGSAKHARTDANGYFEMTAAAGEYVVEATAPGMKPSRIVDVEVTAGEETDVGTIVLRRGITLRGRVVRADDETPVVGAAVRVTLPGPFGIMAAGVGTSVPETVVSGSDGSFRVEGLEAGSRVVVVEHPSFASAESHVDLAEGVAPPEVVVRMSAGGTLTGTVRGGGGVALPNVQVVATSGLEPGQALKATTNDEGRYVLERLRPGNYQVMLARQASSLAMKSAVITEGETTVLDFDEEPPITLEGRVLRGDEPLGGVGLFFMAGSSDTLTAGSMEVKTTRADDAGSYSIGLDHAGTYQVQVLSAGSSMTGGEAMIELVVPDEPRVQRDIVLRTAGISGTVTTTDGEPVAGAFVTAQLEGVGNPNDPKGIAVARTDTAGLYKVGGLEDGIYRVTGTSDGYAPAEREAVEVSPATPEVIVDLVLRQGRLLRGKVIDPAGNVVQGAMVYVTPAGSTSMAMMPSISNVQGQFEAHVPSDDPVDVLVFAGGWAPTVARGVNPDTGGLEVRVSRGGSVRVRVTRRDGRPAAGVQVRCMPTDPTLAATASFSFRLPRPTDANGVTVVDLLAPGQHEVTVPERPGVQGVPVEVRAGTESSVDLSL